MMRQHEQAHYFPWQLNEKLVMEDMEKNHSGPAPEFLVDRHEKLKTVFE